MGYSHLFRVMGEWSLFNRIESRLGDSSDVGCRLEPADTKQMGSLPTLNRMKDGHLVCNRCM